MRKFKLEIKQKQLKMHSPQKTNYNSEFVSRVRLDHFNPSIGLNRGVKKTTEIIWYFFKVFFFLTAIPFPQKLKKFILKLFGAKIGTGLVIKPRVNIHMPWKLEIGNNVWIGEEVFLLNFEKLQIGNNVCISQRSFLCGGNHSYKETAMPYKNGPITLKDGVWVGACVFIGPNVTVGVDTVIAACSVVSADLKENAVYKGSPAIFIKTRWESQPDTSQNIK